MQTYEPDAPRSRLDRRPGREAGSVLAPDHFAHAAAGLDVTAWVQSRPPVGNDLPRPLIAYIFTSSALAAQS